MPDVPLRTRRVQVGVPSEPVDTLEDDLFPRLVDDEVVFRGEEGGFGGGSGGDEGCCQFVSDFILKVGKKKKRRALFFFPCFPFFPSTKKCCLFNSKDNFTRAEAERKRGVA